MAPETRRAMAEWTAQQTFLTTPVSEPPPPMDDSSTGSMSRELVMEEVKRQVQIAMQTLKEKNTELQGAMSASAQLLNEVFQAGGGAGLREWTSGPRIWRRSTGRRLTEVQERFQELQLAYPDLQAYLAATFGIEDVVIHNLEITLEPRIQWQLEALKNNVELRMWLSKSSDRCLILRQGGLRRL